MRLSTITKHSATGPGSPFARSLGDVIRAERVRAGISQADLGHPFGRAFVSRVEHGDVVPSLPSLIHLADRLGLTPGAILERVNSRTGMAYTPTNGRSLDEPC